MPEMNDRRPRTQMRVKAKDMIPGDHYVHPETGSVTPVAQVTPDMGDYDSGRPANGHFITMANGRSTNVPNNSKHTVLRLNAGAGLSNMSKPTY